MTDDLLRDLGKQLPWDPPTAARRDAVRASLLDAARETATPTRGRSRWLVAGSAFAAGVLAAAAVALVIAPSTDRAGSRPAGAAQITASSSARLEHGMVTTRTGVDEIVRVRDGTVRVAVASVPAGDHVRLHTHDAELEGLADYEVVVVADSLTTVTVRTGTLRLQVRGAPPIFLAAGQTWRASVITSSLLSPPSPSAAAPDVRAPDVRTPDVQPRDGVAAGRPRDAVAPDVRIPDVRGADVRGEAASTGSGAAAAASAAGARAGAGAGVGAGQAQRRQASETERRFQAGWALLRDGKAREAAVELGAAADVGEDQPLAADARYFQAVALVRAGESREAEHVLVAFLDRAPRSLRRGRASVLLAQLIGDRGDRAAARTWFRSVIDDPDPAIAAAARAGLAKLDAP